jgi:hypothetical protein
MKQKGFAPILLILVIILLGVIGYVAYKNTSTKNSSPLATQTPTLDMVGVWQASGSMGSGWNDRYQFYPSGAYAFIPNQMQCDKTTLAEAGTWKLTGSNLVLTKKVEILAIGGKLIPSSGSCVSKMMLSGYTKQTKFLETPQIITLVIKVRTKTESDNYPSVYLDNVAYWKFNDLVDSPDLIPFSGFSDKNCINESNPCVKLE